MKISRILSALLALLLLSAMVPMAFAAETETTAATQPANTPPATSGTCGDGLTWDLTGSTLTITGSGPMADGSPWQGSKDKIKTVILTGGVTEVGMEAFMGYENLTAVDFGSSLVKVGVRAFQGCTGLKSFSLPATFRRFEMEAFRGCTGLETIHFAGSIMPSFRESCLTTGNHIILYYPGGTWPEAEIDRLESGFGGWLELLPATSEVPAPTVVREDPPPTTAPPTEPTVPPTTAPKPTESKPTEAPATQPPATQPPVTLPPETTPAAEVPTEPTEPVVYTLPTMATEPEKNAEKEGGLNGIVIGVALIGGVLTFFVIGALIARSLSKKGGRYYN